MLFFVLLTGKFYTFGMLRTLNSRAKLRSDIQGHGFGRTSLSNWEWDQATLRPASERKDSNFEARISTRFTSESHSFCDQRFLALQL